ncbi:uncharacterized protein LOC117108776 [Anneissia japonica]|uniref:uncharacterized protein LOC117108776 n=1 Tax=Anneissia japonica TaxID=1529436 RepID=UPI0014256415|nr:uncharacterized protein LOC117108776 [Anneissia japonica]XP_033106816.1 uncharacterized protein LOC117108776 [Anneissia japonica]
MAPRQALTLDMLVRRMPFNARQKMSKMLDPESLTGWKALAGSLVNPRTNRYYTTNDIENFALEFRRQNSPTEAVLRDWGTSEPTVGLLIQILLDIGRTDVINEIMPGYFNHHEVVDGGAGDQNNHIAVRRNEDQNLHAVDQVAAYQDVHDGNAVAGHVHAVADQDVHGGHAVSDHVHDDQVAANQDVHDDQAVENQDVHDGQMVADQDVKQSDHELEEHAEKQNDMTAGNQNCEQCNKGDTTPDILTNFKLLKLN